MTDAHEHDSYLLCSSAAIAGYVLCYSGPDYKLFFTGLRWPPLHCLPWKSTRHRFQTTLQWSDREHPESHSPGHIRPARLCCSGRGGDTYTDLGVGRSAGGGTSTPGRGGAPCGESGLPRQARLGRGEHCAGAWGRERPTAGAGSGSGSAAGRLARLCALRRGLIPLSD